MRSILSLVLAGVLGLAAPAFAKAPTPGIAGGGSVPLVEVLDVAKPYPNLVLQVRLQLVRANVKREQVNCTGAKYGTEWTNIGGMRLAPYACAIGKRTLLIDASQIYYDRNGRKVKLDDPDVMRKAAKVNEGGLTWRWQ